MNTYELFKIYINQLISLYVVDNHGRMLYMCENEPNCRGPRWVENSELFGRPICGGQ